jgi:predicted  nucleic acid-binding Zn-ribbon protein
LGAVLTDDLLELQRLDTTADQLARRRAETPERTAAVEATAALEEHRRRRAAAVSRDQELELAIDALERDGEQLTAQRNRLEAQLKTVVAPRAAEALMHELEVLGERRDALDDQELAALDEQSQLADEIAGLEAGLPEVALNAHAASAALAAVEAEIDGELAAIGAAREALVARLPGAETERYERLRTRHAGVAVSRLEGNRCGGCHLDLSTAELAEVRAVGPGELADCPQCGRLLVP